jgi:hypothetical protein
LEFGTKRCAKDHLEYGKDEQAFFVSFSTQEAFTLSKLYRMFDFPKQKIDDLVALFIHWKFIQMDFTTEGVLYKLTFNFVVLLLKIGL